MIRSFAWNRLLALAAVGTLTACAPDGDVVGAASASGGGTEGGADGGDGDGADGGADAGPAGTPSAGEYSGHYEIETFTLHCEGDCSAPSLWGPVSYCDVGTQDSDYIRVDQDGHTITMDLDQGRLHGDVADDGAFTLQGEATEDGGAIVLTGHFDGAFTMRHGEISGTIAYAVGGRLNDDPVDCHGELEVTGRWDSDECDDDPNACPAEYPICHDDSCNAGVVGDACRDPEHCAAGLVCRDDACTEASPEGGPCSDDEHCAPGLRCNGDVCQVGAAGDPCSFEDDCAEGLACVGQTCSAGEPGQACWSGPDCTTGFCVDDVCTTGANGEPCSSGTDCMSSVCYMNMCRDGAAGEPCDWNTDCAPGLECSPEDVCAAP